MTKPIETFDPHWDSLRATLERISGELHKSISTLRIEAIIFGFIGFIGVGLAVSGVILELHVKGSLAQAAEQAKDMKEQVKDMKGFIAEIRNNVSTQYLDNWPGHLEDITKLLSDFKSDDELAISVDIGYTHFTAAKTFRDEYFHDLLALVQNPKLHGTVLMLVPDDETQRKSLSLQFTSNGFRSLWKEHRTEFQTYCDTYPQWIGQTSFCRKAADSAANAGEGERQEFFTLTQYVQNQLCDQLLRDSRSVKVNVRSIHDPELMSRSHYMWLLHHPSGKDPGTMKNMILATPRFAFSGKGYAWKTQDPRLMEMFWREFEAEAGLGAENKVYKVTQVTKGNALYGAAVTECEQKGWGCTQ